MRSEQIAGWLMFATLLACSHGDRPPRAAQHTAPASGRAYARFAITASNTAGPPIPPLMADVHRVALIAPEPSTDAVVLRAVDTERATRSTRRRRSLFTPRPPVQPKKAAAHGTGPTLKDSGKQTSRDADASEPISAAQLHAIAQILFIDALKVRLTGRFNAETVPELETLAALRELKLSQSSAISSQSAVELCRQIGCDALIIPVVGTVRTREAGTRALAMWASVRVFRPHDGSEPPVKDNSVTVMDEIPAAGAAMTSRAPFQDRYLKEWPQLCGDAARQTAAIAARTLATGTVAPFVHESDRAAIMPVTAPVQADALMFLPGGRTVAPAALKRLPRDVSTYFHPNLLPLLPDQVIADRLAPNGFYGERRSAEMLWTTHEAPDSKRAAALGRRLKVQYVILARVSDLQIAVGDSTVQAGREPQAGAALGDNLTNGRPFETATAEAIGALIRVSDGAVMWRDRTTATTARASSKDTAGARRRLAFDAMRFSLLQLDRRFRQYRLRFE